MYQYNTIPTTNKLKRAGKNSATAIDHILANCIANCQFKTARFPFAMTLRTDEPVHQSQNVQNVHKHNYDAKAIESFKERPQKIDWVKLKECKDSNKVLNILLKHLFQFMIIFSKSESTDKNQKPSEPLDSHYVQK